MSDKSLILEHLGILVTTYCNLNCRNCADLIPKRAHRHYELDDIKSDLSIVLKNVDYIKEVLVIGGETLVYPQLSEILDFCSSQQKIGKLIITTNGVITPDMKLMDNFIKNKVIIRISGYPQHVVPNRERTVLSYKNSGLEIENLENMQWYDIGNFKHRHRTEDELKNVFHTCIMKNCVTLSNGKIFFCSRQMAAHETTFYPDPLENEYIDVRTEEDICKKLQEFYKLPYISTCDYCDGISCETKTAVPTAQQMLKKKTFLDLLSLYFEFITQCHSDSEKITAFMQLIQSIKNNIQELYEFEATAKIIEFSEDIKHLTTHWGRITHCFLLLLNKLTEDYIFEIRVDSPYALPSPKGSNSNRSNKITVNDHADNTADILIEKQEIIDALNQKWPITPYIYNRLFVLSKLNKVKEEAVKCIVCGLSYSQYGILEREMPIATCNLSVTGQDIPYSILMAEKALEYNPNIETIVIPMAYFQSCYDMSVDGAQLHKDVISYINMPILEESRNYTGEKCFYMEQPILNIYNHICNLEKMREERDNEIISYLQNKEYFNDIFPQPLYGGLKFNFKTLSVKEKQESARITAQLNERVCTLDGYKETIKYLDNFLQKTEQKGIRVLFFVPPATRYLAEASCIELRNFYYQNIVTRFVKLNHIKFLDLFNDESFDENDFSDFEHLNHTGAKKLTKIIGRTIQNWS